MHEPGQVSEGRPSVRRLPSGAVDAEHYRQRAQQERTRYLGELWARLAEDVRRAVRRRGARRELAALDSRALKDLGLARGDLGTLASGAFFTDATRRARLSNIAVTGDTGMTQAVCWFNGEILPAHAARVSVFDHGLLYGDGVFEGIRFYHGRAFRLGAHLERLRRSAAAIRLGLPHDAVTLAQAVRDTIAAFGAPDGYLRLVVTRGAGKLGIDPANCQHPNVFIIADTLTMVSERMRRDGARVIIAATRRLGPDGLDPRIKSLNYLNHVLARMEATNAGADEAILLNGRGHVAEGTADNLFIVHAGRLLTPPCSDGALEGVTRAVVLELAHALGLPCAQTSLGPYDLYTAAECFLTGTGAELIPVREVDGRPLTACPGPVYETLAHHFHAVIGRDCRAPLAEVAEA